MYIRTYYMYIVLYFFGGVVCTWPMFATIKSTDFGTDGIRLEVVLFFSPRK